MFTVGLPLQVGQGHETTVDEVEAVRILSVGSLQGLTRVVFWETAWEQFSRRGRGGLRLGSTLSDFKKEIYV